ncbi:MAG TPA: trypsin-like peptidase domain-containing protein, partial [Bacteroidales bacterium]|nr:trypsin-like peptidase domain-containing protein [Bacteroidales bacterium]
MNVKRNLGTILVALVTALLTVIIYSSLTDQGEQQQSTPVSFSRQSTGDTNGLHYANLPADFEAEQFNFTLAAENTVHAVVHVKTQFTRESQFNHPFYEFFFGDRQRPEREVEGYGSGVILSSDGYIVTNHHVVKRSDELSVTLNDERSFEAEIVGTDPATDLALLKIDAEDLPHLKFGDSRDMKLGEWVLAVGNPFNIGTTVTAGIVSAKGRSIGILNSQESQLAIESFIQTDAAVNKGNSGGALVNVEGELIGINAAIASPTGSYSGYSFAIPAEIASKVVEDLIKYGEVQRAVLGVEMVPMERAREQFDLEVRKGAFVYGVKRDG